LVIDKNYTEMHGQRNIKFYILNLLTMVYNNNPYISDHKGATILG